MITQQELKEALSYNKDTGTFTWIKTATVAGSKLNTGYISIKINQKRYVAHRLAWLYIHGDMPNNQLDHINRNKSDNRIENLRECNNAENSQNKINPLSTNKSGYFGVSYYKNRKLNPYVASIYANGTNTHIGCYNNPIDAHEAYVKAKKQLHKFYVE